MYVIDEEVSIALGCYVVVEVTGHLEELGFDASSTFLLYLHYRDMKASRKAHTVAAFHLDADDDDDSSDEGCESSDEEYVFVDESTFPSYSSSSGSQHNYHHYSSTSPHAHDHDETNVSAKYIFKMKNICRLR